MRKPFDIRAELEALDAKKAELEDRHKKQLADLLAKTGADQLDPEVLAGLLLDGVAKAANGSDDTLERWRAHGADFFRDGGRRRRTDDASAAATSPPRPPAASGHA